MKIENIRYVFDVSNGELIIELNNNEVIKYTYYNNDNVVIGTDFNNDIVSIVIHGFRDYVSGLIDEYIKKVCAPLMR